MSPLAALHEVTRAGGISLLRNGLTSQLSDAERLQAYELAYSDPVLNGIRGDLRTPNGNVLARNVTPSEAFAALLSWFAANQ
jgi:hypothetical protein